MGDITTATGAKIAIGPAAASTVDTASEFAALTPWTDIDLVESLGEFGDESSAVNFASLNDGRTRKAKGTRDAGNLALTCARDVTDPGQQALEAAEASNLKFAFRVTYPDQLTPSGSGSIEYFRGLVMSKRTNVGAADNVIRRTYTIGIDSGITPVAAT